MTEHQHKPDHTQASAHTSSAEPTQSEEIFAPEAALQAKLHPMQRHLTPQVVQALQRTHGNQYTQRVVNNARSQAKRRPDISAQVAKQPTLQRLIGFEIETGIPATKQVKEDPAQNDSYEMPKKGEFGAKMVDGSEMDIDANPVGGGRILEFGSAAVDEGMPVESFKKQAGTWLDLLSTLRTNALDAKLPLPLKDVMGNAPVNARYGKMNATVNQGDMERVSIQVTHAMRLDQVREFLANVKLHNPAGTQKENLGKKAVEASPAISATMATIKEQFPPEEIIEDEAKRTAAVEELEGYFSLIAYYMLVFKVNLSDAGKGYKHRTLLMYKTKLSEVRNKLVVQNPYAAPILGAGPNVMYPIASGLLADTGRTASEDLFAKRNEKNIGDPRIIDWLIAIMSGTGDPAYEAARSSPSGPLKPEYVDGHLGAVVEHRYIHLEIPPLSAWKMSKPDELVTYLATVYEANKVWQGMKEKKGGEEAEGGK